MKADALSWRLDYGEMVEEDAPVQVFPEAEVIHIGNGDATPEK